jgi:hypothetical protein
MKYVILVFLGFALLIGVPAAAVKQGAQVRSQGTPAPDQSGSQSTKKEVS